jgi:hypothetical protein
MSKRERKRHIERTSIRGQRAARRAATTTNRVRSLAVARSDENSSPIETGGDIFANGVMLDLVRDEADDEIKLLRSHGPNITISPRFEVDGILFVPPTLDDDLMHAMNLPSDAADYVSTVALFDDLRRFFREHPGLSEESVSKAAFWVLATWFPEYTVPVLLVSATGLSELRLLMHLLWCACRRSICIGDITCGGLWSLPLWLHPTLVVDQLKPTKELLRVVRVMSRSGVRVPRNGRLLDVYCPIVLCTEDPVSDSWLIRKGIQIEIMPTSARFPKILPPTLQEISRNLQAKLLSYRLRNFVKVQHSTFDAPQLAFPTREIARALGDCIVDDHELQSSIISLVEDQDEDTRVRCATTFEAVVIEAGLFFCHEQKNRESAYVGEFTTVSNSILEGRGEQIVLEPRAVGDVLRSLGLFTCRLGRAGRGIPLVSEIRRKIHELAWRFGVLSIEDGVDRCGFCTEARAQFGDSIRVGM